MMMMVPSYCCCYCCFFFFLGKLNEAWSNAPSLGHESMVLKNLNLVHFSLFFFLKVVMQVMISFLENKWVRHVWMPQINKKNLWVLNRVKSGPKKCLKMQNGVNEHRWSWVPNGTLSRHWAWAMVGQLLTLFQCVFCIFKSFEIFFLCLWPWNTLLLNYKLFEIDLNLIKKWSSLFWHLQTNLCLKVSKTQ